MNGFACLHGPLSTAALAFALLGCATKSLVPSPEAASAPPAGPQAVEVRLAFDDQADLDVFVTDPDQETVYFGNNPSQGGGHLLGDVRCERDRPRVEIVRFAQARRGRYRVGIEYARSCRFRRAPARYRIDVRAPGVELGRDGTIEPGRFEHIALEFDVEGP